MLKIYRLISLDCDRVLHSLCLGPFLFLVDSYSVASVGAYKFRITKLKFLPRSLAQIIRAGVPFRLPASHEGP